MVDNNYTITPLWQDVKKQIYSKYLALKAQNSKVMTTSNSVDRYYSLEVYRERYLDFILDVITYKKIKKINDKEKMKILNRCYYNPKIITINNVAHLTKIVRELVEELGITQIEYEKQDKLPFN